LEVNNVATYYFDATAGNDAHTGVCPCSAKQTFFNFVFAPGDVALLKRGATWLATSAWNTNANAADNVYWGAYGDGAKPHICSAFADPAVAMATVHMRMRSGWTFDGIRFSRQHPPSLNGRAAVEVRESANNTRFLFCEFVGGSDSFRAINNVTGLLVQDCEIHGALNDAVWMQCGDGTVLRRNRIWGYGTGSTDCDGIQVSEHTGTLVIEGNEIVMPMETVKQGIHCTSVATSPTTIVRGNHIHNPGNGVGALYSVEGNAVIEGNYATGNIGRAFSVTSRAVGQTQVTIRDNVTISDWTNNSFGVVVQGAHIKTVRVSGNVLVGRWDRGVFLMSNALPVGSSYFGGNNVIDCRSKEASVGFRNDSATAIVSFTDHVYQTGSLSSGGGAVTLPGVSAANPQIDGAGRPLPGSPLWNNGTHAINPYGLDIQGMQRRNPPSIGAYEVPEQRRNGSK